MTARALATLAVVAACGAAPGGDGGDDGPPPDARRVVVEPCTAGDLELGRCVGATGASCTGELGEARVFEPVAPGGEVDLVVGPQGAQMFVLAARTQGIAPGDPDDPASPDNPLIEIVAVVDGDVEVARYLGRAAFVPDAGGGDALVAPGLFVVADGAALAGRTLRAVGTLEDAVGARRCGELVFVAR